MITDRAYTYEDFKTVRDFLVDTYKAFDGPVNWAIDRFNFTYAFSTAMRDKSRVDWEKCTHLWFEDGELIAVVCTEGEDEGEAFFQVRDFDLPQEVLEAMFDFCEKHLGIVEKGNKVINLRVSEKFKRAFDEAKFRGYKELDWDEITCSMAIDKVFDYQIPDEYKIVSGSALSPVEKGMVHSKAFGYEENDFYVKRSPIGFAIMAELEDYDSELEIYCIDSEGTPVAFCNCWFDEKNRIAILEPVGCDPAHRRKGLAKACIYEGINRLYAMGAKEIFVGSSLQFYKSIGFTEVARANVMQTII